MMNRRDVLKLFGLAAATPIIGFPELLRTSSYVLTLRGLAVDWNEAVNQIGSVTVRRGRSGPMLFRFASATHTPFRWLAHPEEAIVFRADQSPTFELEHGRELAAYFDRDGRPLVASYAVSVSHALIAA